MPLHVPQAPDAALRCVLTALTSPTVADGRRTPAAIRTAVGPLRCEVPLPVHVLDRVDTRATELTTTRLLGWRFLLRGERTVGAAEVRAVPDGWTFSHFCDGPYVAAAERALEQARSLPGSYQPRLLSVPSLYMLMLWLHSGCDDATTGSTQAETTASQPATEPGDLLVPLAPAPPGIAAHQPHRADQLLPRLTRRVVPPSALATPAA